MNVRLATEGDLPAILDMGAKFHAFSGERVPYCRASADASARALLQMGFVLIAERDGRAHGMIGIAVVPLFFNFAASMAQELMWWVNEDGRGGGTALALIRAAEAEARRRGTSRIQMLRLANSPAHVARIYDRLGYRAAEASHVKEL